jgi:hypothetical protein
MNEIKVGFNQVAEIMGIRNPNNFMDEIHIYDVESYMNKASYYRRNRTSGVEDKLDSNIYMELHEVFGEEYYDLTTNVFNEWIDKDFEEYKETQKGNFEEAIDWFKEYSDFDNLMNSEISLDEFMDNNEIDIYELYECMYFAYEIDTSREFILDIAEKMFELVANKPIEIKEAEWVYGWQDEEYGSFTRWEEKDGVKHGQYESVSEDGHIYGQYEEGNKVGTWNNYYYSMMYCSTNTNYLQECNIYEAGELVKHTEYEYETMRSEMDLPDLKSVEVKIYSDDKEIEVTRKEKGFTKYHMYYNSKGDKIEDYQKGKLVNGYGSFTRSYDNAQVKIEKTNDGEKRTTITPSSEGVFGKKYEEKWVQEVFAEGHSNTNWRDGILYEFSNYRKDGDESILIVKERYYSNGQVEMKHTDNCTIFYNEDGTFESMSFEPFLYNHRGYIKISQKDSADVIFERIKEGLEGMMGIKKCS